MPCSVRKVVVHRMTATANPNLIVVGKGIGIIIKAGSEPLNMRSSTM